MTQHKASLNRISKVGPDVKAWAETASLIKEKEVVTLIPSDSHGSASPIDGPAIEVDPTEAVVLPVRDQDPDPIVG